MGVMRLLQFLLLSDSLDRCHSSLSEEKWGGEMRGGGREDGEVETGKEGGGWGGGGGGGEGGKRVVEESKGRWITGEKLGEEENSLLE